MWLWVGRLLSALSSGRKFFVWFAAIIPFLTRIAGWVGRLWSSARNTLLGRLLRMAGLLSVCGIVSVAVAKAVFSIANQIITSNYLGSFGWLGNSFIHSMFGLCNVILPLSLLFDLLVRWAYVCLFVLAVRLGKYILSLTVG